jgi:hypothetical protein
VQLVSCKFIQASMSGGARGCYLSVKHSADFMCSSISSSSHGTPLSLCIFVTSLQVVTGLILRTEQWTTMYK